MWQRIQSVGWFIPALLLLFGYALINTQLQGDGSEYLMMTHAILKHGSAAILPSDLADYHLQLSGSGFAQARNGQFYSIHFWTYSLLALPFYALLKVVGLNPIWAFCLLNIFFAGVVLVYLQRVMPKHTRFALVLFLEMGTTFYLNWTGPEVMSARDRKSVV